MGGQVELLLILEPSQHGARSGLVGAVGADCVLAAAVEVEATGHRPAAKEQHLLAVGRAAGVVRDHHDRLVEGALRLDEQGEDVRTAAEVEVSGRLVRQ